MKPAIRRRRETTMHRHEAYEQNVASRTSKVQHTSRHKLLPLFRDQSPRELKPIVQNLGNSLTQKDDLPESRTRCSKNPCNLFQEMPASRRDERQPCIHTSPRNTMSPAEQQSLTHLQTQTTASLQRPRQLKPMFLNLGNADKQPLGGHDLKHNNGLS